MKLAELEAWAKKHRDLMTPEKWEKLRQARRHWNAVACCLAAWAQDGGILRLEEKHRYAFELDSEGDRVEECIRILAGKGILHREVQEIAGETVTVWVNGKTVVKPKRAQVYVWKGELDIGTSKQQHLDKLIGDAIRSYCESEQRERATGEFDEAGDF